jgi:hypothetical protein
MEGPRAGDQPKKARKIFLFILSLFLLVLLAVLIRFELRRPPARPAVVYVRMPTQIKLQPGIPVQNVPGPTGLTVLLNDFPPAAGRDGIAPLGPDTFAVWKDGWAISDPANSRFVIFDFSGKPLRAVPISYPIRHLSTSQDMVLVLANDTPSPTDLLCSPITGACTESKCSPVGVCPAGNLPSNSVVPRQVILQATTGGGMNIKSLLGDANDIDVHLGSVERERVIMVRSLGVDSAHNLYLWFETLNPAGGDVPLTLIRKYSKFHALTAEVAGVPTQRTVSMEDEFRVKDGTVYQLFPSGYSVTVNKWDTNAAR